jgi:hypothetical protein
MISPNSENTIDRNLTLLPARIILAESDPLEIDRIKLSIDLEFRGRIKNVKNYDQLLETIRDEKSQLLILGRIDNSNYFEICSACHKIWQDLPIMMVSKQEITNSVFRGILKGYGVTDIFFDDFTSLNHLLQALELCSKPTEISTSENEFTGSMMLQGLQEIGAFSTNYFGALAQGNYWRKSHKKIIHEFPSLSKWSVDHFGKVSCDESILQEELTNEEIQGLRIWTQHFVRECERIIVDYGAVLNHPNLSLLAKTILITP